MVTTSLSLLDQICGGSNEAAWARLTQLYSPLLRNWLGRQGVTGADVDDLTQDVLLVVMRKLEHFDHNGRTGAFRNWLRSITVNCSREYWRARQVRPQTAGDSATEQLLQQLTDETSELSREWNAQHDAIVTEQLLKQLKPTLEPQTWQAFEKVTLGAQPAAEVAADLGISAASVYAAKSRVLARLRQLAAGLID